ncbi:hypothetical protein H2248_007106 [Termitomyces sp. 'cryptogamus']|nr:hypothetical protein H2248_007106 [Termitomyces sp. 'cryptogamus']
MLTLINTRLTLALISPEPRPVQPTYSRASLAPKSPCVIAFIHPNINHVCTADPACPLRRTPFPVIMGWFGLVDRRQARLVFFADGIRIGTARSRVKEGRGSFGRAEIV